MNITAETMALMKAALSIRTADLAKAVTTAQGLTFYDLQAPAKNLYPTITKLRNMTPRVGRPCRLRHRRATGNSRRRSPARASTRWAGFPEGQRSAAMSYTTRECQRALCHARRRRLSDLRSGSGGRRLRRSERHRLHAPPAEDDAQGRNGPACRQCDRSRSARRRRPRFRAPAEYQFDPAERQPIP